ncbi:hypothetical protein [Lonepinella sp. BR2271]|uniref:hypothetical protein n=1 Tax=Lonepinella sp. BR2271 TaxID=3434550 RepID=UPI003F6E07DF
MEISSYITEILTQLPSIVSIGGLLYKVRRDCIKNQKDYLRELKDYEEALSRFAIDSNDILKELCTKQKKYPNITNEHILARFRQITHRIVNANVYLTFKSIRIEAEERNNKYSKKFLYDQNLAKEIKQKSENLKIFKDNICISRTIFRNKINSKVENEDIKNTKILLEKTVKTYTESIVTNTKSIVTDKAKSKPMPSILDLYNELTNRKNSE